MLLVGGIRFEDGFCATTHLQQDNSCSLSWTMQQEKL